MFRRRGGGDGSRPPRTRRGGVLAAVLIGSLVVAAAGLASPWWVKSPQQLTADAAPPSPSVLTVPVERRVVSQTVVLRGEINSQQVREVTPAPGQTDAAPILTSVRVELGQEIGAGEVLLEVSGRPLVALPGETPAYRDLRPGAAGEDVAQLQRALQELGYGPVASDGEFGSATKAAVARFYENLGYAAPTAGDEESLDAAESEVRQLERRVEDAQVALAEAAQEERNRAQIEYDRAVEDLDSARQRRERLRRRTGPMVPLSEMIFLPSFPARVHSLNAQVGAPVAAPLLGLASGPLVLTAWSSPAQRELLHPDLPVQVHLETGDSVAGALTSISERLSDGSEQGLAAGPGHLVTVAPDRPLAAALAGTSARLVIEVASTGDEALAVPVSALYARHDGTVYVRRRGPSGAEQSVTVTPELSGDGYVAVRPVDGDLHPGDLIVVGAGALPTSGDG